MASEYHLNFAVYPQKNKLLSASFFVSETSTIEDIYKEKGCQIGFNEYLVTEVPLGKPEEMLGSPYPEVLKFQSGEKQHLFLFETASVLCRTNPDTVRYVFSGASEKHDTNEVQSMKEWASFCFPLFLKSISEYISFYVGTYKKNTGYTFNINLSCILEGQDDLLFMRRIQNALNEVIDLFSEDRALAIHTENHVFSIRFGKVDVQTVGTALNRYLHDYRKKPKEDYHLVTAGDFCGNIRHYQYGALSDDSFLSISHSLICEHIAFSIFTDTQKKTSLKPIETALRKNTGLVVENRIYDIASKLKGYLTNIVKSIEMDNGTPIVFYGSLDGYLPEKINNALKLRFELEWIADKYAPLTGAIAILMDGKETLDVRYADTDKRADHHKLSDLDNVDETYEWQTELVSDDGLIPDVVQEITSTIDIDELTLPESSEDMDFTQNNGSGQSDDDDGTGGLDDDDF